jgi:hypothetical protein
MLSHRKNLRKALAAGADRGAAARRSGAGSYRGGSSEGSSSPPPLSFKNIRTQDSLPWGFEQWSGCLLPFTRRRLQGVSNQQGASVDRQTFVLSMISLGRSRGSARVKG